MSARVAVLFTAIASTVPALVSHATTAATSMEFAPPTTPVGITIDALRRPMFLEPLEGRWDNKFRKAAVTPRVYADESGKSLYVFDDDASSDQSACDSTCAQLWPPARVA